jgi:hypothetical protein
LDPALGPGLVVGVGDAADARSQIYGATSFQLDGEGNHPASIALRHFEGGDQGRRDLDRINLVDLNTV